MPLERAFGERGLGVAGGWEITRARFMDEIEPHVSGHRHSDAAVSRWTRQRFTVILLRVVRLVSPFVGQLLLSQPIPKPCACGSACGSARLLDGPLQQGLDSRVLKSGMNVFQLN